MQTLLLPRSSCNLTIDDNTFFRTTQYLFRLNYNGRKILQKEVNTITQTITSQIIKNMKDEYPLPPKKKESQRKNIEITNCNVIKQRFKMPQTGKIHNLVQDK